MEVVNAMCEMRGELDMLTKDFFFNENSVYQSRKHAAWCIDWVTQVTPRGKGASRKILRSLQIISPLQARGNVQTCCVLPSCHA